MNKKTILYFVILILLIAINTQKTNATASIIYKFNYGYEDFSGNAQHALNNTGNPITNLTDGFGSLQLDGASSLYVPESSIYNETQNFTISLWIKWVNNTTTTRVASHGDQNSAGWSIRAHTDGRIYFYHQNLTANSNCNGIFYSNNTNWHYLVITRSNNYVGIYKDGNNVTGCTTSGYLNTSTQNLYIGGRASVGETFNGSIDEFKIYNRELTWIEINNSYSAGHQYTNYTVNITSNSTQTIGNILQTFYGTNTHGLWGSNESWIDSNGDGSLDTLSNYSYHRTKQFQANIAIIRADLYIHTNIYKFTNPSFEYWGTITNSTFNNNTNAWIAPLTDVPLGWNLGKSNTGGNTSGLINRSTDSRTENYSINLTNNGTQGTLYIYQQLQSINKYKIYNFTLWVKGTGTINGALTRADTFATLCSYSITLNQSYQQTGCSANITVNPDEGIYATIEATQNETVLIDDTQITENGVLSWDSFKTQNRTNTANINILANTVKYAYENNIKVLLIASQMNKGYANYSQYCISNVFSCEPENATAWGDLVTKIISNITNNSQYISAIYGVEVWNEPEGTGFMYDIGTLNNDTKMQAFYRMYNGTRIQIKNTYPTVLVGGTGIGSNTGSAAISFRDQFLGNNTNNIDFLSDHQYQYANTPSQNNYYNTMLDKIVYLKSRCSFYSANCSLILMDEFNIANNSILNGTSAGLGVYLSHGLAAMINNFPSNISTMSYQWAEEVNYSRGSGIYPEYPARWSMVAETQLENTEYASFDSIKNLSTYIPSSSLIYNISTTMNETVGILSNNSTNIYFSVINPFPAPIYLTFNETSISNKYRLLQTNTSSYAYSGGFSNIYISPLSSSFFELLTSDISFASTSPGSNPNVTAGDSQLFSYTLTNPSGAITNTNWYSDGTNLTGCYNLSSCTVTTLGSAATAGHNITATVTSSINNISNSWTLSVTSQSDTVQDNICTSGSGALGGLSSWLPLLALLVSAAVVVGVIGLYSSGVLPSIGIDNLGSLVMVLVVTAITISIGLQVLVSAIC